MTRTAPELKAVVVTTHAVDRYTQRLHVDMPFTIVAKAIEEEVRAAVAANRIADRIPKEFRLYGRKAKGGHMAPNETFVWNEDMTTGWIIRRWPDRDVVTTTLRRTKGA